MVEILLVLGLLGGVSLGVASLTTHMNKSQKGFTQKFEQIELLTEVRTMLNDKDRCGVLFDGQINTAPVAPDTPLDLDHLNWTPNKRLVTKTSTAGSASSTAGIVVTDIKVTAEGSPAPLRVNDPPSSTTVIDARKYQMRLSLRVEKRASSMQSQGGTTYKTEDLRFNVVRRASDNSFLGCYSEISITRECTDSFGGEFDSSQHPNCLLQKLGIGVRDPGGAKLKVIGPTSTSATSNTEDPTVDVRGNMSVRNTLFLGPQKDTFITRQCGFNSAISCDTSIGNNFTVIVGGPGYDSHRANAYRFDDWGVISAGHGFAFNSAGNPPSTTWASHLQGTRYTGLFWNWEPALPNDIGVFINGTGLFRFHAAGDFYTARDIGAARNVTASGMIQASDSRFKTAITPLEGSLDKVTQLQGVRFDWKDRERGAGHQIGLIAQKVETVFPELVTEIKGMKYVAYQNLVAPIIEAVKELRRDQQRDRRELEDEIRELRRELEALKAESGKTKDSSLDSRNPSERQD